MKRILVLVFCILFLAITSNSIFAVSDQDCENGSTDPSCIDYFTKKISDLGAQKKTLAGQIDQFDNQIKITQLKIADAQATISQLEKEINVLGFRIGYITDSVGKLETLLKARIVATYQQSQISNLEVIMGSDNFSDLMQRVEYLRIVQENDKKLLTNLQQTKSSYANQKDDSEKKQQAIADAKQKLEVLGASLDAQKAEKQALLKATQNDEDKFQRLLAQAQAEQAIVFGGGTETYLRDVNQGDTIGTIASWSASPGCSTGSHLHFEVHQDNNLQDPNNYLSPHSTSYSYGPDQYSYYGTINPNGKNGNLPWPLNDPIYINQGYGSHTFAQIFYANGIHTGIDMDSGSSSQVKAVTSGKLYGGSYNCSNGKLFYAKLDKGDGLTTWYLHTIPQ